MPSTLSPALKFFFDHGTGDLRGDVVIIQTVRCHRSRQFRILQTQPGVLHPVPGIGGLHSAQGLPLLDGAARQLIQALNGAAGTGVDNGGSAQIDGRLAVAGVVPIRAEAVKESRQPGFASFTRTLTADRPLLVMLVELDTESTVPLTGAS